MLWTHKCEFKDDIYLNFPQAAVCATSCCHVLSYSWRCRLLRGGFEGYNYFQILCVDVFWRFDISLNMIVNTSEATICATEAAKKEGTGNDFDSEANNEDDELKDCLSLWNTNEANDWTEQCNVMSLIKKSDQLMMNFIHMSFDFCCYQLLKTRLDIFAFSCIYLGLEVSADFFIYFDSYHL